MANSKVTNSASTGTTNTLERLFKSLSSEQKLKLQYETGIPERTLRRWVKLPGKIPVSDAIKICKSLNDLTGEKYTPLILCQTEILVDRKKEKA